MDAAVISLLLCTAICVAIAYLRSCRQRCSIDAIPDFPGKIHASPAPRIGGLVKA